MEWCDSISTMSLETARVGLHISACTMYILSRLYKYIVIVTPGCRAAGQTLECSLINSDLYCTSIGISISIGIVWMAPMNCSVYIKPMQQVRLQNTPLKLRETTIPRDFNCTGIVLVLLLVLYWYCMETTIPRDLFRGSKPVTCESLVSREFSRIFFLFHFSISISRHFHFTFHSRSRSQGIFISLFILEMSETDFHFTFHFSK